MCRNPSHTTTEFDTRVDQFDAMWHGGSVPQIEDFLPPQDSGPLNRQQWRDLLAELAMIDLEFRWRHSHRVPAGVVQESSNVEGVSHDALPQRPHLEDYLHVYSQLGPLHELPIELIANEYRVRQRWGDRPLHSDYVSRFRRHGRALVVALEQVDTELAQTGRSMGLEVRCPHCRGAVKLVSDATITDICCPSCGSRFSLLNGNDERGAAARLTTVGHFELLQKLGSGTFGTVWKAHDRELDRVVAVKIPRWTHVDDSQAEQFLREARVVAQLNHPNIVAVHEVGREGDTVFIVTDFIVGDSLADWLVARQTSVSDAATTCATIADALHHAHQSGVIHRDLKPQNVIVDTHGEPKLTDFGLARREMGEVTMTIDGQVLGTPAYMSPEQAEGRSHQADRRSDVYSLGVILFQMLTGEVPFRGSVHMLMHQIIHDDVPHPRRLNGHVPRDLETICLKCLEKSARKRYQTAHEVAEELRRFLRGEPIEARAITRLGRVWRWCWRYPMAAAVVALLALIAIVGPLVALNQARLAEENRRRLYAADMVVAQQAWEAANVGRVRELLTRHQTDLRGFQWYYLWRLCESVRKVPTLGDHQSSIWSLAFSPDGKTLASGSTDGAVVIHRERVAHLAGHSGAVLSLAFAPDGQTLVSAGSFDRTVKIWDVGKHDLRSELRTNASITCVAISPADGRLLAWGNQDGTVSLCDYHTLKQQRTLKGQHAGWITSLAFAPDGRTIVSGSVDHKIHVWDVQSQQLREILPGHDSWVRGLAISPDGTLIASAGHDKIVKLWDLHSGQWKSTLKGHRSRLWSVAFSPDGNTLASASSDGSVKLWDTASGTEKDSLVGHENPTVLAVAYSPNGRTVASAGADAKIKLWDVTKSESRDKLTGHDQAVTSVTISPNDSTLASASADTTIRLWDVTSGTPLSTLQGHTGWVNCVDFSHDGSLLASAGNDGMLKLWDTETGVELTSPLPVHGTSPIWSVAFSPDDKTLASGDHNGVVTLWDMETTRKRQTLVGHDSIVWPLAFSPDGRTLASGGWIDKSIRLWDVVTGQPKAVLREHTGSVYCVTFSRDGRTLASGSEDTTIKLWDVATGTTRETLRGHAGEVMSVAFSPGPGAESLASGSSDTTLRLWYPETKREPETLTGHQSAVTSVVFSSDGLVLASGSEDNTIRLWRRASEEEVWAATWQE